MNRKHVGKWGRRIVWGMLAAVLALGCNPLNIAAFLIGHDEKVPAPYPLAFSKDGPKKDKEEIVVLLLPHVAPGNGREFAMAERDLSEKLSQVLPEMAKENKDKHTRKVRVISPTQVDKFKTTNPNWRRLSADEIGQKLNADFVLDIELDKLRLYQPGSLDAIYEGRAEISVSVYEIGDKDGVPKQYPLSFAYPRTGVRDTTALTPSKFKQQFFENMAVDIARMHTDYKVSNSIADGR